MNKSTRNNHCQKPRTAKPRPEIRREPVRLPTPPLLRQFLLDVAKNKIKLLMFACLQLWLGLRPEEAYQVLIDPWSRIKGDRFYLDPGISKRRYCRVIRICPAAWAWLYLIPEFADRSRTDFRLFRDGKPMTARAMQMMLNRRLRAAGLEKIPAAALRRVKLTAAIASGVPVFLVMQEGGIDYRPLLHHHVDCCWSREMGVAFFSIFPTNAPHNHTDFDLYRADNQDNL